MIGTKWPKARIASVAGSAVRARTSRARLALWLASLVLSGAIHAGDAVHVDDHGGGRYTLTTTLDGTTDPAHGQLAIVPTAEELCGELHPHYGHYRFESSAPSEATGTSPPASPSYEPEVAGHGQPPQSPTGAPPPLPPPPPTPPPPHQ